jgi:hypothetical protein
MDESLKTKLGQDLKKSGFESEMRALQLIQNAGWFCSGASIYFDKDESITRSVDAHAYISFGVYSDDDISDEDISNMSYNLFIEVKKSERPWVVFRRPANGHADNEHLYQKTIRGIDRTHIRAIRKAFRTESLTGKTGWQGYGVHEAFKEPQESGRWYAAAVSACKACCNYIGDNDGKFFPDEDYDLSVVQPVVVLDGPLIAAQIGTSGEVEFEEIPYAPFSFEFGTEKYKRRSYRVDLVSLASLPEYLNFNAQRSRAIYETFEQICKDRKSVSDKARLVPRLPHEPQ